MKKQSKRKGSGTKDFPVVHSCAAGIDIGSQFHVVAVPPGRDTQPVRTFRSFTGDLREMAAWLSKVGVTTIAMESTSVYWIPAFELLEAEGFDVVLVNARDAKQVPGRKTDINDAQWLQRLHEYGLLRASFRPRQQIAALRSYVRQRERLLESCASRVQHIQKALMEMNVQLHHVVADITGVTGMKIVRAIAAGEHDQHS
jgi:transposase